MRRFLVWTVIFLILVGGVYWAWRTWRVDPQLTKVQEMQAALMDKNVPLEKRWAGFAALRSEVEKLPPQQQGQFRQQMGQQFQREVEKRISGYFALPPDQRLAYLDQQIDTAETLRKLAEQFRSAGRLFQGANAAASQNNANSQGRGDRPPQTAQQRAQARKSRLDRTTPVQRAQFSAFVEDFQKRRGERGLPPLTMGPPAGGGAGSGGGGSRGGGFGKSGFGLGR